MSAGAAEMGGGGGAWSLEGAGALGLEKRTVACSLSLFTLKDLFALRREMEDSSTIKKPSIHNILQESHVHCMKFSVTERYCRITDITSQFADSMTPLYLHYCHTTHQL